MADAFGFSSSTTPPPALAGEAGYVSVAATYAPEGSADLLGLYATNNEFRKVVWKVSDAVGSCRWRVLRNGKELPDHPLAQLLRAPNPDMSGPSWRALVSLYLDVCGESFDLLIKSDRRGFIWDVCPAPPPDVKRTKTGWDITFGGRPIAVPRDMVVWIKHHDPRDPYGRGLPPALALADDIVTCEASVKWVNSFFRNGARPDLIMSMEGADQATVDRARAAWNQKYQGAQSAHQAAFLGGAWKAQAFATNVKDLALVDLRNQARDAIREMYGVPPELFGQLASSNRATVSEAEQLFAKFVVLPRLELLKREWEAKLLPALGMTDVELDYDSPLPEDIESRKFYMEKRPEAFTVNEFRREAGLSARADGDVYLRLPSLEAVDAGEIEDMTDQARMIAPPSLPSAPVLYLLRSPDAGDALEAVLASLPGITPTALAGALVRHRTAVESGEPSLDAALVELERVALELAITDLSSARAALMEAA